MKEKHNSGFAIVPKEVLCDRELHPIAKVVSDKKSFVVYTDFVQTNDFSFNLEISHF